MPQTITSWRARASQIARDEAGVSSNDRQVDSAIKAAFAEHSAARPREAVAEIAGAGSAYLDLPVSAGWVHDWSQIVSVEYPARENPPRYIRSYYLGYSATDVTARKLVLVNAIPAVGQYVRLTFTSYWPAPDAVATTDLLPVPDFEAVSHLVAAHICSNLAAIAANDRMAAMETDLASGSQRAVELRQIARELRDRYRAMLAPGPIAS